jgi:hypothetical protein
VSSIVVGVLLILAAVSGDFVLRGTDGETGQTLLAIAGFGSVAYGVYRVADPRVVCRLCGETMRKARLDEHLKEQHGLSRPEVSEKWWSDVFRPPTVKAGTFAGSLAGVTLECDHRYQEEISKTPAVGNERVCPTCGQRSRVTRVSTPS